MSNMETLEQRDNESREHNERLQEVKNNKTKAEFTSVNPERKKKTDRVARYNKIIEENELLFAVDFIKEMLSDAYDTIQNTVSMKKVMRVIVDLCDGANNKHFL